MDLCDTSRFSPYVARFILTSPTIKDFSFDTVSSLGAFVIIHSAYDLR
jgi:hypothetical protein